VDAKRFLHAEIHPNNVMSDKIENLHAYFLKHNMVRETLMRKLFYNRLNYISRI